MQTNKDYDTGPTNLGTANMDKRQSRRPLTSENCETLPQGNETVIRVRCKLAHNQEAINNLCVGVSACVLISSNEQQLFCPH